MGLTRDRAVAALDACTRLDAYRKGVLRSFLGKLSDDGLLNLRIDDTAPDDEIIGFLDQEEKQSDAVTRAGAGGGAGPAGAEAAAIASFRTLYGNLPTPSDAGLHVDQFISRYQSEDSPLIHNLRPHTAQSTVPVQLAVPTFQRILAAAWPQSESSQVYGMGEATAKDMDVASDLCVAMSASFTSEAARVERFHNVMKAQGGPLAGFHLTTSRPFSSVCDVSIRTHEHGKVLGYVEAKSNMSSGDASLQGSLYFVNDVCRDSDMLSRSFCPALLLELVGPQMRLSGMACIGGRVVCEPLTPLMNLLALHNRQPGQVVLLARCLHAMRQVLLDLSALYTGLAPAPAAAGPAAAAAWGLNTVPLPHDLQAQLIESRAAAGLMLDPAARKMVYVVVPCSGEAAAASSSTPASCSPGEHVVKYVRGPYGAAVHGAWHAAGLAPQLVSVRPVVGPWVQVVMEHLGPAAGWLPLDVLFRTYLEWARFGEHLSAEAAFVKALAARLGVQGLLRVKARVLSELDRAHAQPVSMASPDEEGSPARTRAAGLGAHGDMRPPNALVQLPKPPSLSDPASAAAAVAASLDIKNLRVAFIDFDWAGVEGAARYPHLLNLALPWPDGACSGELIQQQHDKKMLDVSLSRLGVD